jgi:hypothetical protein
VTPVVDASITVSFPRISGGRQLRRAHVTYVYAYSVRAQQEETRGARIDWKSGSICGIVYENDEGIEWIHGHGPQARAALLVARGLG